MTFTHGEAARWNATYMNPSRSAARRIYYTGSLLILPLYQPVLCVCTVQFKLVIQYLCDNLFQEFTCTVEETSVDWTPCTAGLARLLSFVVRRLLSILSFYHSIKDSSCAKEWNFQSNQVRLITEWDWEGDSVMHDTMDTERQKKQLSDSSFDAH